MTQEPLSREQLEAWLVDLQAQVDSIAFIVAAIANGDEVSFEQEQQH